MDQRKIKIALSLFDGMSCGQLALKRAGISVDYYLASEVDKAAMSVAKKNFPETKHIGDVREVDGTTMDSPFILMGGSPCQSFSFAGKRKGMATEQGEEITTLERYLELKREGFQFSGQSYLFWEYVRILKESSPRYFLLENVKMAKKWEDVISETLGLRPILINSALVSAQNRKRLYWTNIPGVDMPEDNSLTLSDVWDPECENISEKMLKKIPGTLAHKKAWSACKTLEDKAKCLTTNGQGITNSSATNILVDGQYYRPSVMMCERLQTVPENYTAHVSNSQRYKMLGNGWTVDVIAHILSHIPEEEK